MAGYGSSVYGVNYYGEVAVAAPAGRAIAFQPRLYAATMQNQLLDDISDQMISGSVTFDQDLDGSKMTFIAEMRAPYVFRPLVDFVAPFLRITYEDGSYNEEQVGLFVLIPTTAHHYPGASTYELDGRDLCWLLDANQTTVSVNDSIGDTPVGRARQALNSVGITRQSLPLDSVPYTKAVTWGPGTSRLQRINDRMVTAGYYTLWFDRHGIATSRPYDDMASVTPAVTYTGEDGSRIVPPIDDSPDMTRVCNRAIVLGTDPTSAPIVAIRENNDPTSPVSYQNLGNTWISRTTEDPNIQTQAAANALADDMIRNGASYNRTLTLQTLPDPARNPRETYALNVTNDDGVVIDGLWRCTGWTLPLDWSNPVMQHQLSRVEPIQVTTP